MNHYTATPMEGPNAGETLKYGRRARLARLHAQAHADAHGVRVKIEREGEQVEMIRPRVAKIVTGKA